MQYLEALGIIGGLSRPSKIPWYGWSISATTCVTGSKLRDVAGSVCEGCYAMKGNYTFRNVKEAHERRAAASTHPLFVRAFVLVLNTLRERQRTDENRFRWFDSGDIPSLEFLEKINAIAEQTPEINHWLPTREFGIVRDFIAKHGNFAPNLQVRMSAAMIGDTFARQPFGLAFSTVGRDNDDTLFQCPASNQGNKCLDCRNCWTTNNVNYGLH